MKLAVGTDKGLLVYERTQSNWELKDIHFIGMPVGCFHYDERNQSWWVALNHKHWGPKLYRSVNQGETFKEITSPRFKENSKHKLKSIWTIAHGHFDDPNRIYIGVEPAALFVTTNDGQSFEEIASLSEHPSRDSWQGGGKGSNNPFLHTVLIDREDTSHLTVGISCAGVFQSEDAGQSWKPTNEGLEAFYLPNRETIIGHDPHTIKVPKTNTDVMWQQNHCGIYRSENKGQTWTNISDKDGKASYGFALVADDKDATTAWVIPAQSDHLRIPHQSKLTVYKTTDAGKSWQAQRNGLPQNGAFDLVLRAAFDGTGDVLAFGTNNGNLYISENGGENWQVITQNLSAVRSVSII